MQYKTPLSIAVGLGCALLAGWSNAAAPDWSKVESTEVTIFYPGVSAIEWITKGTEHGGARALKMGERCADCHSDETADMGQTLVSGQKLEPKPIKGKAGSIPVSIQSAHDGTNLYLRFTWKQPAGGAEKMDPVNQAKLSILLSDNKVVRSNLAGCWEACHNGVRTMPDAKSNDATKYIPNANLAGGVFFDLMQWTSKGVIHDGHIADKRVMDGGKALVEAKGVLANGTWTVTFVRKLASTAPGDITLQSGKIYNLGFAIHDDYSFGRFHHVSLEQHLGIDVASDITAKKQ